MFAEEQWEKELDNELQEFELVDDGSSNIDNANQNEDWEKDADELLGDNDEDLKWMATNLCKAKLICYWCVILFLFLCFFLSFSIPLKWLIRV